MLLFEEKVKAMRCIFSRYSAPRNQPKMPKGLDAKCAAIPRLCVWINLPAIPFSCVRAALFAAKYHPAYGTAVVFRLTTNPFLAMCEAKVLVCFLFITEHEGRIICTAWEESIITHEIIQRHRPRARVQFPIWCSQLPS